MALVWVFLGGGLGASARYGWTILFTQCSDRMAWPLGTFTVNIAGCLALGLVAPSLFKLADNCLWPKFIIVGFLGGFTTFSSFALEALNLITEGHLIRVACYVAGSIIVGILAVLIGFSLSRTLIGA